LVFQSNLVQDSANVRLGPGVDPRRGVSVVVEVAGRSFWGVEACQASLPVFSAKLVAPDTGCIRAFLPGGLDRFLDLRAAELDPVRASFCLSVASGLTANVIVMFGAANLGTDNRLIGAEAVDGVVDDTASVVETSVAFLGS
jgi:hypothetical protein